MLVHPDRLPQMLSQTSGSPQAILSDKQRFQLEKRFGITQDNDVIVHYRSLSSGNITPKSPKSQTTKIQILFICWFQCHRFIVFIIYKPSDVAEKLRRTTFHFEFSRCRVLQMPGNPYSATRTRCLVLPGKRTRAIMPGKTMSHMGRNLR